MVGKLGKLFGLIALFAFFTVGFGFSATELSYDDGSIGSSGTTLWSDGEYAVKFTPAHKGKVVSLGAYVAKNGGDDEWKAGLLYSSNHSTLAAYSSTQYATSTSGSWKYVSFSSIVSSPFYGAVSLSGSDNAGLGKDGSSNSGKSEAKTGSSWSTVSGNHMIRAYIDYFPEASDISFSENPTTATSVTVYGKCVEYDWDDDVDGARVRIDGGSWQSMSPSDGSFNHQTEWAYKSVSISSLSSGDHTVEVACEDENNNWGDPVSATLTIGTSDTTDPEITYTRLPAPNGNGWNNESVVVDFSCTDSGSGISACTGDETFGEGAGQSAEGYAKDVAGNEATLTVSGINVDMTAPEITSEILTSPAPSGWYLENVVVRFSCTDSLSGVVSSSFDITVSAEGEDKSATGTCTDLAGNSASATVSGLDIDKTAPSITGTVLPSPNGAGWNKESVTVSFSCSDAISGIFSCTSDVPVSAEGETLVEGQAVDLAGNSATYDVTVKIDTVSPETESTFSPASADGLSGWYVTSPEVTLTATDASPSSGIEVTKYKLNAGAEVEYLLPFALSDGVHELKYLSRDVAGNSEEWNTVSNIKVDTTAPEAPEFVGNLTYFDGDGDFYVAWSASSDATSGIRGYALYRSLNGGSFVLMGTFLGTTYHEQSPGVDARYGYKVAAIDNAGNEGEQSEEKVVVVDRLDPTAPLMHDLAPYIGETEVNVSWDHAEDTGTYPSGISYYDFFTNSTWTAQIGYPLASYMKDSLSDGMTYAFSAKAWDKSDPKNEGPISNSVGTTVDLTAPETEAVFDPEEPNGNDGWYISRPSISFSAEDSGSGVFKTYYCFDQVAASATAEEVSEEGLEAERHRPPRPTPCTPSTEYTGPFQINTEGTNYVRFYSVDNVGNVEDVRQVSFKQDLNEPTGQMFRLNGGDYYSNDEDVSAWHFAGFDTSSGSGLDYCTINWGDEDETNVSKSSSHSSHEYSDGEYEASYVCFDKAGHSSEPETDSVFVDTVDPETEGSLSPAEPSGDNGWYSTEVEVTLTATDAEPASGVRRTYYCVDQVAGFEDDSLESSDVEGEGRRPPRPCEPETRYTRPFTVSDDGTNYVRFYSVDNAGNSEETRTIAFDQDETAPESEHSVSPRSPNGEDDWYVSTVDVTLEASDETSGVSRILYCVSESDVCSSEGSAPEGADDDDSEMEPAWWWHHDDDSGREQVAECVPSTPYDGTFSVLLEGTSSITYRAIDNAGNEEETHTFSFKQDWTAPKTLATTEPSPENGENGWFTSTVLMNLTATDGRAPEISEVSASWWWHHDEDEEEEQPETCVSDVSKTYYCVDYGVGSEIEPERVCATTDDDYDDSCWSACYPETEYEGTLNLTYEGLQTVRFYSVDSAGNSEEIAEEQVYIDTVAPLSEIVSPLNGTSYVGLKTVLITGNSSDENSGMLSVGVVAKTGVNGTALNWTSAELLENGTWAINFTPTAYGTFRVYSTAVDSAGNYQTEPGSVYLTFTAPPVQPLTYGGGSYRPTCGNGVCNANIGEDANTCPQDCKEESPIEPFEDAEEVVEQVTTTTVAPATTTTVQPTQGTMNPRPGTLPTGRFLLFDLADGFWQWINGLFQ